MRLCYFPSRYHSLARAAKDYIGVLKTELSVSTAIDSDVCILHCLPYEFDEILNRHPGLLNKNLIAYCTWEATDLPEYFKRFVPLVREIWTCSQYCKAAFERYHPTVVRVPHIVHRDAAYSQEDLSAVKSLVSYDENLVYFLTITSLTDRRKNTPALIREFSRLARAMPRARLIVKTVPISDGPRVTTEGNIVCLHEQLSYRQINALYDIVFAYVSAHHSEGWGMTMSDAMLFRKPVIATGYSGNLEFMNTENSLLLKFTEEHIHAEDQFYLFDNHMKWAYPDSKDLAEKLQRLYDQREDCGLHERIEKAYEDARRFNQAAVLGIMMSRLRGMCQENS
jgi:glycosyltransferase involved in cell wall biosynthesis